MNVGDNILDTLVEARINENLCLLNNWSKCNSFINGKYLSNIRDVPDGKYPHVHCNTGVTYTRNIGDPPIYSNHVWYKTKGIANILYLSLVRNNNLVTYNIKNGNELFFQNPQHPTLNMNKAGILYHDIRHLIKNKNLNIMVNDSRSPIPQVNKEKKGYTAHDINSANSKNIIPEHH